tara:strand:+ start:6817 stop:9909 length:3093 start_codon:yes stop_codon:yes gene_type:complete
MAIKVRQGGAWIDVTGGDDNTTYTLPLTGATGGSSVGSAKWTLDASTGTDTSVTLNPGSNINISAITTSGNDRSFTLEAANTTYDYLLVDHGSSTGSGTGNDSILRLDPSTGTNDDIRLIAGTNVIFSPDTSAGTLTIAATPGGVTTFIGLTDTPGSYTGHGGKLVKVNTTPNGLEFADETTYLLKCTRDADGGSTGTDGDPYLFLDASSGTDDSVQIVGASGISVTRNDDGQLTIDGSNATGTTYTLPVFGSGNGSSGLRLTGSDSSTDDVNVTGSGGITVIGSGTDTLTISGSGVAGTKYDYVLVDHGSSTGSGNGNDSILRLDGATASGNTDDDIRLIAGSNVTFTPDTGAGTLIISSSGTGSGTTYDLGTRSTPSIRLTGSDTSTDDITFAGTGNISVTSGGNSQSGGTITIDGSSITGTTYDYLLVDHGSSTGAGSGNDSVLRLDPSSGTDDDIRLIAGSNVTFTPNTGANTLTIAASGGASGPTYTLPLTGSSSSATWTLTPSSGTSNAVKLNAGTNVSFSSLDTTGPDYEFTIDVASAGGLTLDTTVTDVLDLTGGTLGADDAGADRIIFWDESATKLTHLTVGTNLSISGTTLNAVAAGGLALDATVTDVLDLTGVDLSADDPGADRIIFWDESGNKLTHLTVGTNLSITGTTLNASTGGGTDEYVDGVSWNTGNGILTLTRAVGSDLTVDLDGRYAEGNTKYDLEVPAGTTKIRLAGETASGNTNDDIELVGGTNVDITRNSSTQLTIDFDTAGFALDKIIEGDTKAEVVDSGSNGHFKIEIDGTERFRVENNGNTLLKRTDTSLEGGHLQFEDSQGAQSFALDVYGGTSLGSSLRVVDQISGNQRLAINRYGAIAVTTGGNYGSTGQVLTSNGATGEANWGDGGGSGAAVCYGYLSGTSNGSSAGTIAATSYNIANHSGSFGSNDGFNDNFDGGIQINLTTGTGSSNYPVVVSGYNTASGVDFGGNYDAPTMRNRTTLHAYDINSTYFKLQGRIQVYYVSSGDNWYNRYPDRISFAGFKN